MDANEHGLIIGNEAVFTKIPARKEPALIGMDFLRLALERATTARGAMETIIELLETHGQGGDCGHAKPLFYHNSFLTDPAEAWVLETADVHWAASKVRNVRSISNRITFTTDCDFASENLVRYAIDQGWCKTTADFNFSRATPISSTQPSAILTPASAAQPTCFKQKRAGSTRQL